MKRAVIEILYEDEKVLGSTPIGNYLVREYDEDDDEISGTCHETIEEAEAHVREYQK
jgi:hypothetical protein